MSKQKWISVTERMPENDTWVLVVHDDAKRPVCDSKILYIDPEYGPRWITSRKVSYWMPLPEPPKEGE